jgi:hypothetical protein
MIIIKTDNFIRSAINLFKSRYRIKDKELFRFIVPKGPNDYDRIKKYKAYFEDIDLYIKEDYGNYSNNLNTEYLRAGDSTLLRLLSGEFKVLFHDFIPEEKEVYSRIDRIILDVDGKTVKYYNISRLSFASDNIDCILDIISGNCFAQDDFITLGVVQEFYDKYRKLVNKNEQE